MEFTIERAALQKELGFVQGVVERKNTIPILSNILIETLGERTIRITGTDLDVTIRSDVEADITTPGSICIQARKLFDITRLLPDAPVKFTREENYWVTMICERAKFRVPGVSVENFPELPGFKSAPVSIPAGTIRKMIERTIFAVTMEETRYALSGAKFIIGKEGAVMVATDGHRLALISTKEIEEEVKNVGANVLIPKKTLGELNKLLAAQDGSVKFGSDESHVYFEVGNHLLISRLLNGKFPNYEMVIPQNNDKVTTINAAELNRIIKRVSVMADEQTRVVKLGLRKAEIKVSAKTAEEGEATETAPVDYSGEEVEIGFNTNYVQDFLSVVGEGEVSIELKDSSAQALLKVKGEEKYDYKYIIMPMRI
ncbi:MAG: DNA polymerase III subunit beta [Pyrinomonadaceae bacterium]